MIIMQNETHNCKNILQKKSTCCNTFEICFDITKIQFKLQPLKYTTVLMQFLYIQILV